MHVCSGGAASICCDRLCSSGRFYSSGACIYSCRELWNCSIVLFALSDLALEAFMRVRSGVLKLLRTCSLLMELPCQIADALGVHHLWHGSVQDFIEARVGVRASYS